MCVFSDAFTFRTPYRFSRCRTCLVAAISRVTPNTINLQFLKHLSAAISLRIPDNCVSSPHFRGPTQSVLIATPAVSHNRNDPMQSPERGRCLKRIYALSLKVTLPPFSLKKKTKKNHTRVNVLIKRSSLFYIVIQDNVGWH